MEVENPSKIEEENRVLFDFSCRFCDTKKKSRILFLPDAMYGSGRQYQYVECTHCLSLQILNIPVNIKEHYPDNYRPHLHGSLLRSSVTQLIDWLILRGPKGFSPLLYLFGLEDHALRSLRSRNYPKSCRILEIGCGSGRVLKALRRRGFCNIVAADPFVSEAQSSRLPFKILRKSAADIDGCYDLIIVNHVFEHLADPVAFFSDIKRLLSQNGELLLLTPIANSSAWRTFRERWIQADAPRHLNIPSEMAIDYLAQKFKFIVSEQYYNGTEFQILGSQQCIQGIPLISKHSVYSGGITKRIYLIIARIRLWKQVQNWNEQKMSDQAVFFLRNK